MPRLMLREDQWERLEPLLPGKVTDCGVTAKDNRLFIEAVLWIARTGAMRRQVFEYIELDYNRQRRHSAIGMISPEAFEARMIA